MCYLYFLYRTFRTRLIILQVLHSASCFAASDQHISSLFTHFFILQNLLTKVSDLSKILNPCLYHIIMSGLYHTHNISKGMIWNVGIIITKQAITCTGYPYFCRICCRCSLGNMNMNRLKWLIFICPKINPVLAKPKNSRHYQILPLVKTL